MTSDDGASIDDFVLTLRYFTGVNTEEQMLWNFPERTPRTLSVKIGK